MSQTRKTWDGLRVWAPLWYRRNPQDFIRAIPDRMAVIDGRPRPADEWQTPAYGPTDFCLTSSNGTNYIVHVADDGAMLVTEGTWGQPQKKFYISDYVFTVDNDGALHVEDSGVVILRFKNDSIGTINYNVNAFGKNYEGCIYLHAACASQDR